MIRATAFNSEDEKINDLIGLVQQNMENCS